jgi:hypothetical protein
MKLLGIDPSGNHIEGSGTTGLCRMVNGVIMNLNEIKASGFDSPEAYWMEHVDFISMGKFDAVVMEGFKLYKDKASTQIQSQFETPQLIGVIRMYCYEHKIPLKIQYASEVKTRWSEKVLVASNILEKRGQHYYWNGELTNNHKRDALKHALHFWRYKK